jgi:hypothetical protein
MLLHRASAGVLLMLAALTLRAAGDSPEALQLARFKDQITQDLARIPDYTCLETITRSERRSASRPFDPVDTVRVEVSSVAGKEIYAWPGARQFEEKDLTAFVSSGANATGLFFSAIPHDLFARGVGIFEYRAPENLEGRNTVRYDYRISQSAGGLTLRIGSAEATVALKGSFWFDPASGDLVRLDSYGDQMPPSLGLSEALVKVQYARVRIGNSGALLPRQGEMQLTHLNGSASRNVFEFTACRAYQTESAISFEPPAPAAAVKPQVRETDLPAGLLVPVVLETAIDSKAAALGDPVRARVRADARRDGNVLLPAGAVIAGRIRRLERKSVGTPYFVIGVELFEVEWENKRADFYGELVEIDERKGMTAGYAVRGSITCILQGKTFRIDPGLGLLWRILDRPPDPAPPVH